MAQSSSPLVTLKFNNASLLTVLQSIKKQTKFTYIAKGNMLEKANKVSVDLQNVPIEKALDACFKGQPLRYSLDGPIIIVEPVVAAPIRPAEPASGVADRQGPGTPQVHGRVVDENNRPVIATVQVKGSRQIATTTDEAGYFTLSNVTDNATLVISAVNIETMELKLIGRSELGSLQVKMKVAEEEEIVVAYNKTTTQRNIAAVTVVKGEQIQNLPNRSFEKSLQGLVPGLLITQGSGQPGGGVANFVLRGIATGADPSLVTSARNPLVVLDGMPLFQDQISLGTLPIPTANPLAQINPSDIETITVLKDAAAIALFGSKASNGVILVTTKKGKEGKTTIGFRHQTDFAERLKGNEEMLSQAEYLELLYETYKNTDPVRYTDATILADLKTKFPTRSDGSFYPEPDWLNELYKKGATTFSNELSVSGGSARQTFYLNLEYTKQDGILRNTGFDRKSVRFNYESRPASWIKMGISTYGSYNVQEVGASSSESGAARISPLNVVRGQNGELIYNYQWGGATATNPDNITTYFSNPVAAQQLNFERNNAYRGLIKLSAESKFLKYFTLSNNLGADLMLNESKLRVHPKLTIANSSSLADAGYIKGINTRTANLISTNTLRFDKVFFNNHSISLLAGHEAQLRTTGNMRVDVDNISSNPLTEQFNIGATSEGTGYITKETQLSYFGQLNYGLLDRYFLSGSIRRDGSSLFGENNQFGSHWSAGGGWVVSAEPFMKATAGWLDLFKLRGSIGSAGNSAAILNTLRYHRLSLFGYMNSTIIRLDAGNTPNPSIKWEKTFSWDAGVDLKLFKERVSLGIDLYQRKTADLVGTVAIAPATGYANMRTNIGDMTNSGVEISFSADIIRTKDFTWRLSGNWSRNKNRLIKSSYPLETAAGGAGVTANSVNVNGPGENYNSFYLVTWAGVDPATGKPLWIDSTGKPSSNWSAGKPSFVGKPQPDGFGSFSQSISWKSLSLSMMFSYQYEFQLYVSPAGGAGTLNDGLDPFINQGRSALDRWQKPGDIATNPRRLLFGSIAGVSDNATANSTRYLIDGDFIRLANLSLAYRLPAQIVKRLYLASCNVYLQGSNLATWTKYSGRQDSENSTAVGRASTAYPLQRSFSIGCNINF